MNQSTQTATFASGCFWCTEAVFDRIKGVISTTSGYSGGDMDKPNYGQVSAGNTGHAEALQVEFDPEIVSYETLVDVFFASHDPTTPNQQGYDIGPEYRSIIFYRTPEQEQAARQKIEKLDQEGKYDNPIVTEVVEFKKFFPAEDYHQDFYEQNKNHPYCQIIIDPKITKLIQEFPEETKQD